MSPNQPKTPISGFRLDEATKESLRRSSAGTNMSEVIRSLVRFREAMERAVPEEAAHAAAVVGLEDAHRAASRVRHERSALAVEALADYILDEEWPSATPRQRGGERGHEARRRAAAILAGEAWAIRKTWPEAAYDIQTRDWR